MLASLSLLLLALEGRASAGVDFVCSAPEGTSGTEGALGIIGVPPIDIVCDVIIPQGASYSDISWTVGDGTFLNGEHIEYRYEEEGQFTISVYLSDYTLEGDAPADLSDAEKTRYGFVTACGQPQPQFTYTNKGGLDIQIINQSDPLLYCLDSSSWEVYEGESASGGVFFTSDVWEPRFSLPSEGLWTIRLVQEGLAGTRYSDLTFDAKSKLTDDIDKTPNACAHAPTGGSLLALGALGLMIRSRRR